MLLSLLRLASPSPHVRDAPWSPALANEKLESAAFAVGWEPPKIERDRNIIRAKASAAGNWFFKCVIAFERPCYIGLGVGLGVSGLMSGLSTPLLQDHGNKIYLGISKRDLSFLGISQVLGNRTRASPWCFRDTKRFGSIVCWERRV